MDGPKRVTVKDVVRWHRHTQKAKIAGFTADDDGIGQYREKIFCKFRSRHRLKSNASASKQSGPQMRGIDGSTAVGARIIGAALAAGCSFI